jgi:phage tail-like protein
MNDEAGFFYLNGANQWPGFQLSEAVEIASDGALILKQDQHGFAAKGAFLIGPFEVGAVQAHGYRLRAWTRDPLPDGAHFQLFTYIGDAKPPAFNPNDNDLNPNDKDLTKLWNSQPLDIFDVLIQGPPAGQQWMGGVMRSDGQAALAIVQMRVDYGRDTYLDWLPAIYAENGKGRDFLRRSLSLDESALSALERTITDLPRLFDPDAAPTGDFPSWLSWLAGWLSWDVDEDWSEAQARRYLARAFDLYGRRGTIEGLRQYLKTYGGVSAHISEPALQTTLWTLGMTSTLGLTTMLAPGYAQGAALNATATLDRSHLTSGNGCGSALFEDVAHRFCVEVYCAELTRADALEDARSVLDREKPAHTEYHLRVIEPRMRVGAQARVGIDAIVAEGPPLAQIGMRLGTAILTERAEESKGGPHGSSRVE